MPNPCKQEKEDLLMRMHPDLSRQQAEELLVLAEKRDEDIDLSDIPEIRAIPPNAVRGKFYRSRMIILTTELQQYFADLSRRKGIPMNDLVNETLAKALAMVEVAR
jgi:hypothetical protein